jgi:hypothetical protein
MNTLLAALLVFGWQAAATGQPQPAGKKVDRSRCHIFVDYQNIWTLEMVQSQEGKRVPILNIITFTEGQWEFKPPQIKILNRKGRAAQIKKFSIDTGIAEEPYETPTLKVLGNGFIGVDLIGDFDDFGEPTQVVIDLGDVRFELEPMECLEFDMLAEQINKVNFDSPQVREDFDVLKIPHLGKRSLRSSAE